MSPGRGLLMLERTLGMLVIGLVAMRYTLAKPIALYCLVAVPAPAAITF